MRFTDEQLSRILSEHEAGNLMRGGAIAWWRWQLPFDAVCCINQAAFNEPSDAQALLLRPGAAAWFDSHYNPAWTSDEFLAAMEGAGL